LGDGWFASDLAFKGTRLNYGGTPRFLAQLVLQLIWGQKGNYLETATDCPQRDERMGWTGDTEFFVPTAAYNYDVQSFFRRHLVTLCEDSQHSDDPAMVQALQQPSTNSLGSLTNQLVAYWKMDDGLTNSFATTVTDSKGTNSATLARGDGASHWLDSSVARFGGCLKLDGTNASVTIPQTGSLNINTNAITFSAWVRLLSLPSQLALSYGSIYDSTTELLCALSGQRPIRAALPGTCCTGLRPYGITRVACSINHRTSRLTPVKGVG
jgi:hypothetical protein